MRPLKVGAGRALLTPPAGTPLAGYFEPHFAAGVANDLMARAVVFDDGVSPLGWVACDVLAIADTSVTRIRREVERRTGLQGGRLLVCATHTHTGPLTAEVFGQSPGTEWLETFEERVVTAVADAAANTREAQLSFGTATESRLSGNRRLVFRDGAVHTHTTDADWPEVVGREGPVDHQVALLSAEDVQGHVCSATVNFALHPTNVRGDDVCSDYPGYLSETLGSSFGAQAHVAYLNGACGDLDSKTPYLQDVAYGPERARRIADILVDAALLAHAARVPLVALPLQVRAEWVRLPLKTVEAERVELGRRVLTGAAGDELHFTRGTRRPSGLKERIYAEETLRHAERVQRDPYVEAEVQLLSIGELAVIGVPVELFCEWGLAIKTAARKRFRHVMVAELANGYHGYMPTRKAFEGGGYETRLASSSCLTPEAGELLLAATERLIESIA